MNTVGGVLLTNPKTGDPEPKRGFTVNVEHPREVTIHGNYTKGFFVSFKETGIEMGPYPDPGWAHMVAERWDGILERAN
jgi:hypothetical protein